ncbi:hypothetical protein CEF21_05075 [Bacillus sp. FJAT-42376]|uniref:hypothetical protein n=1 Tax=Bacillus sp. FJAT-42376 TaxID=2014076 RepID=UPI000F4D653D|nr:hypothetical protein [Bacillus sp. FJAT-42376]AZB41722.1 hypothetical protein CEF21_05075 [Bacillus sp. FJAT-42376]
MNTFIFLFQILLGLTGVGLFFWKHSAPYYLLHFFVTFLLLSFTALILWNIDSEVSYVLTALACTYFVALIPGISEDQWPYFTFLLLPIILVLLAGIGLIEKMIRVIVFK